MEAPRSPRRRPGRRTSSSPRSPPRPRRRRPRPQNPSPLAPGPGGGRDRGGPRGPSPGPPHAPPRPPQAGGPRGPGGGRGPLPSGPRGAQDPLPFLLRAAERALAELEIPLRPLVGQVEGEEVRGLKPSPSFLALFREAGGEEGEGLLCFHGEEEVHTGRPSLFLSPEGLLAASGLEAPWRGSSWSGWPSTWKTPSSSWPRGASPPLPLPPPGTGSGALTPWRRARRARISSLSLAARSKSKASAACHMASSSSAILSLRSSPERSAPRGPPRSPRGG